MAEKSSFFNSVLDSHGRDDRIYDAADWAAYFASFIQNGVFAKDNGLAVSRGSGMNIQISAGMSMINGYFYINDSPLTLTVSPATGSLPRYDRVVVQLDIRKRLIAAVIKKGTQASNPAPPELQRDEVIWEIALADIEVLAGVISIDSKKIFDMRATPELCGYSVGQSITSVDMWQQVYRVSVVNLSADNYIAPGQFVFRSVNVFQNAPINTMVSGDIATLENIENGDATLRVFRLNNRLWQLVGTPNSSNQWREIGAVGFVFP